MNHLNSRIGERERKHQPPKKLKQVQYSWQDSPIFPQKKKNSIQTIHVGLIFSCIILQKACRSRFQTSLLQVVVVKMFLKDVCTRASVRVRALCDAGFIFLSPFYFLGSKRSFNPHHLFLFKKTFNASQPIHYPYPSSN